MGLASPSSFLRRLLGRQPAPEDDDAADMGTALGLEVSLGPVSAYLPTVSPVAGGDTAEEDPPMGWLGRRLKRGS
jgi:hypothetical protein